MRYGIDAKLFDWSDEITADCPRRQASDVLADGTAAGAGASIARLHVVYLGP
jgi:hypothetical protein